jgi:hypothetical protein
MAKDAWGRQQLVDLLAPAAVFAPHHVLEMVDRALAQPARTSDWSSFSVQIDDVSVRLKLPVLLTTVGRHPHHARAAMERLWLLGRDDVRPTSSHPQHPVRVRRELGGYDMGPDHRQALIDLVAQQAAATQVNNHRVSPLTVLDALLARDGMRTRMVGLKGQITSYWVRTEATEPWRAQVRALLVQQALHGTARQRVVAAGMFDTALRVPPSGDEPVPEVILEEWRADQLRLLDTVRQIAEASTDPAVRAKLAQGHRQDHRRRGRTAGLLRLPGRALDPPAHDQPHRVDLRHGQAPDQGHQGARLQGRRDRHGIQADRGRSGTLARRQRTPPRRARPRRGPLRSSKLVERDPILEATQAADDTPVQPPAASNQPVSNAA